MPLLLSKKVVSVYFGFAFVLSALPGSIGCPFVPSGLSAEAFASEIKAPVIKLTVESLEEAWKQRHDFHTEIVGFLQSQPAVPDDFELIWRVSRLALYGASSALPPKAPNKDKMAFSQFGYELADKARKKDPNRVEGHYWYAVNFGYFGSVKGIMASLGGAKGMKEALDRAIEIQPSYDFAGPHRVRGRLYNKLPGGFISFGDNKKAAEDLLKATELAPNLKLNHIWLAEVVAKTDSKPSALAILEKAKKLPDVAGVVEEAAYKKDIATLEKDLR